MAIFSLRHPNGSTVQIHDYAAHVTSWQTADGVERLFLSKRAEFGSGVAIRGGVPIIFPQFATLGPYPRHGFARTQLWQAQPRHSESSLSFVLADNEVTRQQWPYRFEAQYQVALHARSLEMTLRVRNTDQQAWGFTAALHTYLRVTDITQVKALGLQGLDYRDFAQNNQRGTQTQDELRIEGEVDRIYFGASRPITVYDDAGRLSCSAAGFGDAVIWNPGAVKSAALSDIEPEGYRRMLCVEAAVVAAPVQLSAGKSWLGSQRLEVLP